MDMLTRIQKQIQFLEGRRNVIYRVVITEDAVEIEEFKCPYPSIFSDVRDNCGWEYQTEFKIFNEVLMFFERQAMALPAVDF